MKEEQEYSQGGAEWSFDAPSGKIREISKDGKTIVSAGPELFMVALKTGPCNTEHSLDIETLNDPCQGWQGRITATGKDGDNVYIEVEGSYEEADLKLRYNFDASSRVTIDYEIIAHSDINPRQLGLVFTMPRDFDQLSWKRHGQWTIYPDTHIGRTEGTAKPFPNGMLSTEEFGETPDWIWEADTHPMGSNDFRATRDKLINASLKNSQGNGIKMYSDGTGAFRAFIHENRIKFLGASFSTAGGDMFFSSHLASERQAIKKGEVRKGQLILEIL